MAESENKQPLFLEKKFMGLGELALKWGVNKRLLRKHIDKVSKDVPMYEPTQRVFAPVQYLKIAELLCLDI